MSPSRSCSRSPHAMIDGCHRKSFNYTISAFSAPTEANVPVAGLLKALYNFFNGEIMKVLPVFAGP